MQLEQSANPHRVRLTGAVVFRGDADAVDRVFDELRRRGGIELIYLRSGAGRLRIVDETRP